MPKYARIGSPNGEIVKASDIPIDRIHTNFYCMNDGCNAKMILVNPGSREQHFRSKSLKEHAFYQCIKDTITFHEGKYDESEFDLTYAFQCIIGSKNTNVNIHQKNEKNSRSHRNSIGGGSHLQIRTLKVLYDMCISRGIEGTYNGIPINEILASIENFNYYQNGISGFKIVEASYFFKLFNEPIFLFNFPTLQHNHKLIKIIFSDSQLAWDYYHKLKKSNHREPIIIAGDWEIPVESDCISQCTIYSKRQIAFLSDELC